MALAARSASAAKSGPAMPCSATILHLGEALGHRLPEGLGPLAGDVEVGGVRDDADLALLAQRIGHELGGGGAVAVIVGRDDADIVLAGDEALGRVLHEDELHAASRGRAIGRSGGDGINRQREDHIRLVGQQRLDVGRCRAGVEAGIADRDDLHPHGGELGAQPLQLAVSTSHCRHSAA